MLICRCFSGEMMCLFIYLIIQLVFFLIFISTIVCIGFVFLVLFLYICFSGLFLYIFVLLISCCYKLLLFLFHWLVFSDVMLMVFWLSFFFFFDSGIFCPFVAENPDGMDNFYIASHFKKPGNGKLPVFLLTDTYDFF